MKQNYDKFLKDVEEIDKVRTKRRALQVKGMAQ